MGASDSDIEALWEDLVRLCNDQISTPPFARLLNQKFTRARAQQYSIQMAYYVQNRRDCWGYVQGSAPLEIKKIIWQHEEDELIGRKSEGKQDHMTLAVKEGEVFGLSAEAFERTARLEGGEVCFSAWIRLAQRPWLEAIAGSAILEMRNSGELIKGGSLSYRIGEMLQRDLAIPMKKQINNAEHVVMAGARPLLRRTKRSLHQQPARLLGLRSGRRAAGSEARHLGTRERRADQ